MNTLTYFKTTLALALIILPWTSTHTSSFAETIASARKCIAPITHFKKELFFDISSIKKDSKIAFSEKHKAFLKNETLSECAKYTRANGQELWFFLDQHRTPSSESFITTLLQNEKDFTHGLLECEMVASAICFGTNNLTFDSAFALELEYNSDSINTIPIAYKVLQQQEKIILAIEFDSTQEALEAYKKENIFLKELLIGYIRINVFKKIFSDEKEASITVHDQTISFKQLEEWALAAGIYLTEKADAIVDTLMDVRNKKMAQNIIKIMNNSSAKKVLVISGSDHWIALEELLEEHFGKPEILTP